MVMSFKLLPAVAILIGGIFGSRWRPTHRLRGVVAHLVGGVVLGTAAADLMPAASEQGQPIALSIGFCLGFSLMIVINHLLQDPDKDLQKGSTARPMLVMVLPFAIDSLIDGLVVGIGSGIGSNGWIIPIAIALEMGLSALGLGALLGSGASRQRSTAAAVILSLSYVIGLGGSEILKSILQGPFLTAMLAFGTAALIYLVVEEVMKEAHAEGEDDSGLVNLAFFLGILAVWLLDSIT